MNLTKYQTLGNNLSEQIDNAKKMWDLITNIETDFHINFIKDIIFNATIVKHNGEICLYGYSYKGCISKFDFLNDENFIKAIKLTNRKNIRTIK